MSKGQDPTDSAVGSDAPPVAREPLTPLATKGPRSPRNVLIGLGAAALVVVLVAAVAAGYFLVGGSSSATPTASSHPAALGSPTTALSGSPEASQTASLSPSATPSHSAGAIATAATPTEGGQGCGGPGPVVPVADVRPGRSAAPAAARALDPAHGHFGPTGALMLAGVGYDTATRLANGKVLFVGGSSSGAAAVYDPAANTFTPAGSLVRPRADPIAVLLASGKVLVLGGYTIGGCAIANVEQVELWDPSSGHFTSLGTPLPGSVYQAATLLTNGKVLIAGGEIDDGSGNTTPSAALYDPSNGHFTATGVDANNHTWLTATRLASGNVLMTGIDQDCSQPGPCTETPEAATYNPATGHFTAVTGSIPTIGFGAVVTLLSNGKVLLAGGEVRTVTGSDIAWVPTKSAFLYDPATGSNGAFASISSMTVARQGAAAVLLPNGSVLIAGGFNGTAELASAELYDPTAGTFALTNPMTAARSGTGLSATMLQTSLVLVVGNSSSDFYNP